MYLAKLYLNFCLQLYSGSTGNALKLSECQSGGHRVHEP